MKRILVVDDDVSIQRLLREKLEECGHQISIASNCKEAISVIMNKPEKPDLVILDLRIPKMSGLDTLRYMLKLKIEIPAIINMAYSRYNINTLVNSVNAYFVKSSDKSDLKMKVNALL